MEKVVLFNLIFIFCVISCFFSENTDGYEIIPKINDDDNSYSIQDFLDIGFKINKEYDVSELPLAEAVFWGFWNNKIEGPKEFEIRFYNSHQDAKVEGMKYAEEIIGKDAVLTKNESTWKEGVKDRRWGGFYLHGTIDPKYYSYVIYGNVILFCEGRETDQSIARCSELIAQIKR